jgi:dihydropteroate synthase
LQCATGLLEPALVNVFVANLNILNCGGRTLDLSRPQVMGTLNVTPDSFSDGNQHLAFAAAVARAEQMASEGAAIIDVGGESTRPGAAEVPVQQELDRVIPVIEAVCDKTDIPVSCDTSKPEVMTAAVAAGAGFINDVFALQRDGALEAAVACSVPVCLMHMQGEPRNMQDAPEYTDVVTEVGKFLAERARVCEAAGIPADSVLLDPGFGFGKRLEDNLQLLQHLGAIAALGKPILAGLSRKSMLGQITGLPVDRRKYASVAAALLAAVNGASLLRVHDVAATVEALAVYNAMESSTS